MSASQEPKHIWFGLLPCVYAGEHLVTETHSIIDVYLCVLVEVFLLLVVLFDPGIELGIVFVPVYELL